MAQAARSSPVAGRNRPRLAPALFVIWLLAWLALAITPRSRQEWLLKNLLVIAAVPWLWHRWRTAPFSDLAWSALFVFFSLHAIGAHHTYSEVPYDASWQAVFGTPLDGSSTGEARNHFDRVVHFGYGLLVGPAAVELIRCAVNPRGLWRWLLPWTFLCTHSLIHELIEWGAATLFGGDLGFAYLGTQGDPWGAQKDMALAALGAACGVGFSVWLGARERSARGTAVR